MAHLQSLMKMNTMISRSRFGASGRDGDGRVYVGVFVKIHEAHNLNFRLPGAHPSR